MKTMLIIMSMIFSMIFMFMNHPLTMGLILLIQTILISISTGLMSQSFWFSYVLFLIFIGGMLILFIYVASLASNEMFLLSVTSTISILFVLILLITIMMKIQFMSLQNQETTNFIILNNQLSYPLLKLYNQPTNLIMIMMVLYLFLTLIVVVKIIDIFKGPLRQMN